MMNADGDFSVLPNLILERLCPRTSAVAAPRAKAHLAADTGWAQLTVDLEESLSVT
jgi:hypothetical protein